MTMVAGVAGDRGNMVLSFAYSKQVERSWAAQTLYPIHQGNGAFTLIPSGSSNSRKIRVPGEGNWIVDATSGEVREFDGITDIYDYSPVNALVTPNERWQMGVNSKVEVSPDVEAYAEALYTRRTSHQRLAPDASFAVTGAFETPNNGLQWNDYVPASNPFNPFGVNPNNDLGISDTGVRINRRFVESGGRIFRQTNDTYRLAVGFRGEFHEVDWDFSYTYAETETTDETLNYGRFDRWATAVDPDACDADAACPGTLNPFGDFGSITGAQMAYLSTGSLKDLYSSRLEMFSFTLAGDVGELDGGTAGWAVGAEQRRETGFFTPDEFLAGGLTTGGAGDPQAGSFSVSEYFGELYLPFTDRFEMDASARYSDYDSSADQSVTYKIGGAFQLIDDVRLRGTFSTGFRAPNITELNQGPTTDFPVVTSVCEFGDRALASGGISQTTFDNCVALGMPTDDTGELEFAWQSLYTTNAPTTELDPEESETLTFGVVYQSSIIDSLQVSVDYWNIEIDDVIGFPDMNDLYRTCMSSANLSSVACNTFGADGPHNMDVYWIGPGDAVSEFGNLGKLSTDGWDIEASYSGTLDAYAIAGYDLSWSATI